MTTTEITNISSLLDLSGWFGDFAGDYDTDAVLTDYVTAIDDVAGAGITVTACGLVFADLDHADRARQIDWKALADDVDLTAIAERHERA